MDSPHATFAPTRETGPNSDVAFVPFDAQGAFIPMIEGDAIRHLAVRGVGVITLAQAFGIFIQLVSTLILARLLLPADFGIVTMATTFSLLFMNAGLNGYTEAIIQREEINQSLASNLFWINLGTGVVLTLSFAAAGHLLAWFFSDKRLTMVAVGISLTILITSTSVLHLALLMRGMRFTVVNVNSSFARVFSVAVAILLACAGWGYWALVGGAVAQPLSESIGAWALCRWKPSRPQPVEGTGAMVHFALKVYGRFSFNYFARNADNLLIGWRFNAQALGFYKKAYDLFAMSSILTSFTPVVVSALSRARSDIERYRQHILSTLSVCAFLGMGVGGALTLDGKDLIRILLGPKWQTAGEIFTYFGPGFGLMFIYVVHGWIHVSAGKPGRWFRWGIIEFVVTGSMFLATLRWGAPAIAMSWSASLLVLTLPALAYAGKPVDLRVGSIIRVTWRFVIAAVMATSATAFLTGALRNAPAPTVVDAGFRLAKTSLIFTAIYLSATCVLHWSFRPISQLTGLFREMLRKTRPPETKLFESPAGDR